MTAALRRRRALLGLLGLALAGCGPTIPLQAGLREAGASVVFGTPAPQVVSAQPQPPQFPPPAINPVPNFPAPLEQPPIFIDMPPQSPAPACAVAPPGAVLAAPAVSVPSGTPRAATYAYRYEGSKTIGSGSSAQGVPLAQRGTRTVAPASIPQAVAGSYAFSVKEEWNGVTTTDTYWVVPNSAAGTALPNAEGTTPAAGIYLVEMTVQDPSSGTDDFQPQPPVELMPLPATVGETVQSSGVDGRDGEAMEIGPYPSQTSPGSSTPSEITGHGNVDACGILLDSWQVVLYGAIENARTPATSPPSGCASTRTFQLTVDFGTEYGGFPLSDHLVENGQDQITCKPFSYDVTATIDEVPQG